jgi:hypothetical protein
MITPHGTGGKALGAEDPLFPATNFAVGDNLRACKSPEEYRAWSQNLGHEHGRRMSNYRQAQIMWSFAGPDR